MVYGLLALLVVLLDQATKYYVVTHFALIMYFTGRLY